MQNANSENSETDLKRDCKGIIIVGGDSPAVSALFESIGPRMARLRGDGGKGIRVFVSRILLIELPEAIVRDRMGVALRRVTSGLKSPPRASADTFRSRRSRAGKQERWR